MLKLNRDRTKVPEDENPLSASLLQATPPEEPTSSTKSHGTTTPENDLVAEIHRHDARSAGQRRRVLPALTPDDSNPNGAGSSDDNNTATAAPIEQTKKKKKKKRARARRPKTPTVPTSASTDTNSTSDSTPSTHGDVTGAGIGGSFNSSSATGTATTATGYDQALAAAGVPSSSDSSSDSGSGSGSDSDPKHRDITLELGSDIPKEILPYLDNNGVYTGKEYPENKNIEEKLVSYIGKKLNSCQRAKSNLALALNIIGEVGYSLMMLGLGTDLFDDIIQHELIGRANINKADLSIYIIKEVLGAIAIYFALSDSFLSVLPELDPHPGYARYALIYKHLDEKYENDYSSSERILYNLHMTIFRITSVIGAISPTIGLMLLKFLKSKPYLQGLIVNSLNIPELLGLGAIFNIGQFTLYEEFTSPSAMIFFARLQEDAELRAKVWERTTFSDILTIDGVRGFKFALLFMLGLNFFITNPLVTYPAGIVAGLIASYNTYVTQHFNRIISQIENDRSQLDSEPSVQAVAPQNAEEKANGCCKKLTTPIKAAFCEGLKDTRDPKIKKQIGPKTECGLQLAKVGYIGSRTVGFSSQFYEALLGKYNPVMAVVGLLLGWNSATASVGYQVNESGPALISLSNCKCRMFGGNQPDDADDDVGIDNAEVYASLMDSDKTNYGAAGTGDTPPPTSSSALNGDTYQSSGAPISSSGFDDDAIDPTILTPLPGQSSNGGIQDDDSASSKCVIS